MSTTENGWTKGVPQVDGDYWQRRSEFVHLGVVKVVDGDVYIAGHLGPRYIATGSEFLGPISPSDFEQLAALRKAGADALKFMEWNADPTKNEYPKDLPSGYDIIAALREALKGS